MTVLTDSELLKITRNNFTLDFVRAKLVQQTSAQPNVYKGSGSIYQDTNGKLRLKLYCCVEDSSEILSEFMSDFNGRDYTPGKIVGPDGYYSFEGVDLNGGVWTASDVAIDMHNSVPAGGRVVYATRLRQIQSQRGVTHREKRSATLFVPGKFRVPFTHGQSGTVEKGLSSCTLEFGSTETVCLKTKDGALVVDLATTDQDVDNYTQRILEALGIAVGERLRPQVEIVLAGDQCRQIVRSIDDEASRHHRLVTPMPTNSPNGFSDFQEFINRYLSSFNNPYDQFAGYWARVLFSSGGGLENQALVLTTAIEGVLKSYFSIDMAPDAGYVDEIARAKPLVQELDIGERARQRLLNSLGGATTPTASNALRALENHQRIPPNLHSIWRSLRNKMSHADELQWDDTKRQLFVDDLYGCLELFYRLLMLHIDYQGHLTSFSKTGWPIEPVAAFRDEVAQADRKP